MMRDEQIHERLSVLESHIDRDRMLLEEYEDISHCEDDPRRLARYEREIKRQHESIARYQKEYDDLQSKVMGDPPAEMQKVGVLLDNMNSKLDNLQRNQDDIVRILEHLRLEVLSRFDISEQTMITTFIEKLTQNQLATVEEVLNIVEVRILSESEMNEALKAVQKSLEEIQNQKYSLVSLTSSNVERLSKVLDDPKIDSSHKLKLAIPIIPLILTYEAEINLKCGVNLKSAWNRLISKARGK